MLHLAFWCANVCFRPFLLTLNQLIIFFHILQLKSYFLFLILENLSKRFSPHFYSAFTVCLFFFTANPTFAPSLSRFWEVGEPNNHIDEDCGYIVKTRVLSRVAIRSWYDAPCSMSCRFVCELELGVGPKSTAYTSSH